jgi:LysM repeat protein
MSLREQFLAARGRSSEGGVRRAEPASGSVPAVATATRTYVVKKGDNPVAIARKHNVSYNALLELNNISDPRKLQVGQTLKIPAR